MPISGAASGPPGRPARTPARLLPAVHRVASLAKRWLLGTHQGSVGPAHLPAYLDEFVFRFNRRRSASRGMVFYRVLELAAGHDPVRFQDLLAGKKPRPARHGRGWGHPPSLERPAANRPWRTDELQLQLPIPLRLSEYPGSVLYIGHVVFLGGRRHAAGWCCAELGWSRCCVVLFNRLPHGRAAVCRSPARG